MRTQPQGGPGSNQHQLKPRVAAAEPTAAAPPVVSLSDDPFDDHHPSTVRGKFGDFGAVTTPDLTYDQLVCNEPTGISDDPSDWDTVYEWSDPATGGVVARVVIQEADPTTDQIVVETVEVHPDHRGRGLSKQMLRKIAADYPDTLFVADEFTSSGQSRLSRYLPNIAVEYDAVEEMLLTERPDLEDGSDEFHDAKGDALDEWWDRAKAAQDAALRS